MRDSNRWCISSGRDPLTGDLYRGTTSSWGPFSPDDEQHWWINRKEPDIGWAPTIEEAWRRWEEQMLRWADGNEETATKHRADVNAMRLARGLPQLLTPAEREVERLKAEVALLREVADYARHRRPCPADDLDLLSPKCSCGYDKLEKLL